MGLQDCVSKMGLDGRYTLELKETLSKKEEENELQQIDK